MHPGGMLYLGTGCKSPGGVPSSAEVPKQLPSMQLMHL